MIRTRTEIEVSTSHKLSEHARNRRYYNMAMEYLPFDVIHTPTVTTGSYTQTETVIRLSNGCNYLALNIDEYNDWMIWALGTELEPVVTGIDHLLGGYRHASGRVTVLIAGPAIPRGVILTSSGHDAALIIWYSHDFYSRERPR